jgi:hypothetical protein
VPLVGPLVGGLLRGGGEAAKAMARVHNLRAECEALDASARGLRTFLRALPPTMDATTLDVRMRARAAAQNSLAFVASVLELDSKKAVQSIGSLERAHTVQQRRIMYVRAAVVERHAVVYSEAVKEPR